MEIFNFKPMEGLAMKPSKFKPEQGRFLISEPFLHDFYFKRSVVLLAEHNEEGSFGVIINKPLGARINEIVEDFPAFDADVFLGGPVKKDAIFFLHTLGELIPGSNAILPDLYWGGDFNALKELVRLNMVKPDQVKFFIGYSGWEPDQLNRELNEKSWIVSRSRRDQIMSASTDFIWTEALKNMGKEYAMLANYPIDPALN